jgi:hypothetical protein
VSQPKNVLFDYDQIRARPERAPRPSFLPIDQESQLPLVFAAAFLLGIGHASPLQQHAALLSIPLQQEWAFFQRLPRLVFFLQQDIAASLQQPAISQQASALWLVFCGGFRVSPAAEMANAEAHAKLIKSTLIFLINVSPIQRIAGAIRKECRDDSEHSAIVSQAHF